MPSQPSLLDTPQTMIPAVPGAINLTTDELDPAFIISLVAGSVSAQTTLAALLVYFGANLTAAEIEAALGYIPADPAELNAAVAAATAAAASATAAYNGALLALQETQAVAAGVMNQGFINDDWPGTVPPSTGPAYALVAPDGSGNYVLVYSSSIVAQQILALQDRPSANDQIKDDWAGVEPTSGSVNDLGGVVVVPAEQTRLRTAQQVADLLEPGTDAATIAGFFNPSSITTTGGTLYVWIPFGQSLVVGGGSTNKTIYTSQAVAALMGWYPYCWMPSTGIIPYGNYFETMIPAYEQNLTLGAPPTSAETGWVRMMGRIHDKVFAKTGRHIRQAVLGQGIGGQTLSALGPGTLNGEGIKKNLSQLIAWAATQGWRVSVRGFIQVHGNANTGNTQTHQYQLQQTRFLDIWNEELKSMTLQNEDVRLYIRQDSLASQNFMTELGMSQAHLNAAMSDSRVCLVGGGTNTDNADGTHKSSLNYIWDAELMAEDIATNEFMGGMTTPAAFSCWQSGSTTFDFDIGAQYALNINTTENVIGLVGLQGYLGCEFTDGSGSPPTITNFQVLDTTLTAPQRTIMRATLSAPPAGPASACSFGLGTRQNITTADGFSADGYAVVTAGVVTNIVITAGGNSWTVGGQIAIGGSGTGAKATSVVGGGQVTGFTGLVGGSGYGGTQTYAAFLRSGAGAHMGARHCFELLRGSYASLGWDGLEAVTPSNPTPASPTQNPRLLNPYLARQFIRANAPLISSVPRAA